MSAPSSKLAAIIYVGNSKSEQYLDSIFTSIKYLSVEKGIASKHQRDLSSDENNSTSQQSDLSQVVSVSQIGRCHQSPWTDLDLSKDHGRGVKNSENGALN